MLRWIRLLSIRAKLIWLVAAMLVIPWMGERYVQEMKGFLLQGQQDALLLTANGVATILNEQGELFRDDSGVPELVGHEQDILAHSLQRFVQVDGVEADWGDAALRERRTYTQGNESLCEADYQPDDFEVTHLMGYRGSWMYALFQVRDDVLKFRDLRLKKLGSGDHVRILLQSPRGLVERYLLVAQKSGRMSAYLVGEDWQTSLVAQPIDDIVATLRETDSGYTVEARFPRYQFSERARMGFSVQDVDEDAEWAARVPDAALPDELNSLDAFASQPRASDAQTAVNHEDTGLQLPPIDAEISTYPLAENNLPGRVLLTSPELTQFVRGLNQPNARIWVLDDQQRVRAVVGGLSPPRAVNTPSEEPLVGWEKFKHDLDLWLDRHLRRPNIAFTDHPSDLTHRREEMISEVLSGKPQTAERRSLDGRVKIVMAGHPIRAANKTVGAVVIEQSSHAILASQYKLLKSLAAASLLAFAFVVLMLIIFAWRLTGRIGRLHDTTERAITREGRVLEENIPTRIYPKDELGDLGRSITSMLQRLKGYTHYLEGLPDTLAHELNNPLNVVSSSLQNLEQENRDLVGNKYVGRAQDGVARLRKILSAITAAANVEEAMQAEDRVRFDFTDLVHNYVEGVATIYPSHRFSVDIQAKPLLIMGSADHLAEMLDKLIDNAVEFSPPNSLIEVGVVPVGRQVELTVANLGEPISEEVRQRVFDPMVSLNRKDARRTHLGLGLYVVRLITSFHEGAVRMDNRDDVSGVVVTVSLPREFD